MVTAGVARDETFGYAGLEPIGHGIGIPQFDSRTGDVLEKFGFVPRRSLVRMVAGILFYRPPVSREVLQFRRTAKLESFTTIPDVRRRASGLSHIDIEQFRLSMRDGPPLAEVEFWFSDPEAEVLSPTTAILDLGPAQARGELSAAESYLVAGAMQSLAARNIQKVETAVDSEKKTLVQQLTKICFEVTDAGSVWELIL